MPIMVITIGIISSVITIIAITITVAITVH